MAEEISEMQNLLRNKKIACKSADAPAVTP